MKTTLLIVAVVLGMAGCESPKTQPHDLPATIHHYDLPATIHHFDSGGFVFESENESVYVSSRTGDTQDVKVFITSGGVERCWWSRIERNF